MAVVLASAAKCCCKPPFTCTYRLSFLKLLPLLTFIIFFNQSAAARLGPPNLATVIRSFLENGRNSNLQQALNLSEHVHYDPISFFNREEITYSQQDSGPKPHFRSKRTSDLAILRAMGLYVPGVDSEYALRQLGQSTACKNAQFPAQGVVGTKSIFQVVFTIGTPENTKLAVRTAVKRWADAFESSITIRICFIWSNENIDDRTLGATNTPYLADGSEYSALRDDAKYTPALASAMLGKDLVGADKFHVHMLLNAAINWHLDIRTPAPTQQYDLVTTVLHELTHGLFFSGTMKVNNFTRTASYLDKAPGRFDQFMRVEGDIGVVRSCDDDKELFRAATSPNLRFFDGTTNANFGLFAPWPFSPGSSLYHFNNTATLYRDCDALNIARIDCSDLMTHELVSGYTQRSLGETTLRVYRAMRSSVAGVPRGRKCVIPDYSGRGPGEGLAANSVPPFTMPVWGIATVAAVGGVGVLLVIGVIISSIAK